MFHNENLHHFFEITARTTDNKRMQYVGRFWHKKLRFLYLLLLSLSLYSCGKSDGFAPSVDLPSLSGGVVITPNAITVAAENTVAFTASGGSGSYSYSIFSGSGSVLSTTGNYTAPLSAGSAVVRVIDGQGQYADALITINNALQISPTNQSLGINTTQAFSTTGGVPPITFSIVSGVGAINASSGVYTAPGVAGTATLRATDALSNISNATVSVFASLGISPATASISINGSVSFSAAGGTGPYVFSIFSGSGAINSSSGVFTAPAVAGTTVVRVTDAASAIADATISIINAPPMISSIANQTLNEDVVLPVHSLIQ